MQKLRTAALQWTGSTSFRAGDRASDPDQHPATSAGEDAHVERCTDCEIEATARIGFAEVYVLPKAIWPSSWRSPMVIPKSSARRIPVS